MVIQTDLHLGKGFVYGDSFPLRRNIIVPPGLTVTKAYLTVKSSQSDADPGLFQKTILPGNVVGQGQVEDIGTNGTAILRFDFTVSDTTTPTADAQVYFSIRVIYSDTTDITLEAGQTSFAKSTTGATV